MLDGMRKISQHWIGRAILTVLFGLLIVSFVIWGVGDMFRGFVPDKVAEVGGQSITTQQYQNSLQTVMYRIQSRTHRNLTSAQAHELGLDRQVLGNLIADAALDVRAASLGMAISEASIVAAVRSDPSLQDASGQFNPAAFDQALRDSGLTERGFFVAQSRAYMRQQIETPLIDGLAAPKPLVDLLARVEAQTRAIDYVTLPPSAAGDIPAPADDALKAYFNERKDQYQAPEYRALEILLVDPSALANPADVSDDDAKADYDKVRDARFATPEKRKLQQIVFPDQASADDAEAKIKAGASFDDIVKARNLSASDVDLGETVKAAMFDHSIADAAFALPQDGVSEVVKGQFGPAIVRVVAITPGSAKTFDEVKDTLKKEIAADRVAGQVQSVHDKIEDARVSGKTLAEAAKTVGLEARSIAAVDAQGRDDKGAALDLPDQAELLASAYASDVGVDDAPLQTNNRGWLWFDVIKVDPARDRAFDEVKDQVEKEWRAEAVTKALSAKADDMVKQIGGGATPESLAQGAGLEAKSAVDLRRGGGAGLAPSLVNAVFTVPAGGAGSAATPDGRVVFKVVADATPPTKFDDPAVKAIATQLTEGLQTSVVAQFVSALENELGVRIHQNVLQSAAGS
ncbi:MAG: SurA N-terminal domain-containing protein [Roseiarcus sp.]|jgi:peptidyl-prolyl cis-trans isomerase D|uniref:peptidylprolyl isomerase n=1 Tax=Roseiarcus sp. TaxID=1969460 RepID=UPI003C135010